MLRGRAAFIDSSVQPPADVTSEELAGYGLAARSKWWRLSPSSDHVAKVREALASTGLLQSASDPVGTLSAGEIQRAWIAAGLATSPAALFIDEPTAHLDMRYQLDVLRTLRKVAASGVAVLAAIHDLSLAARFCNSAALLAHGRVESGLPADVFEALALSRAFGVDISTHRHPNNGYLVCMPSEMEMK